MSNTRKNKHPVLKMPLDLSLPIDKEVYEIFEGFHSGVEAKNFLCSAILYYTRSPLVLSSNAIKEALDKVNINERFDSVMAMLSEVRTKMDGLAVQGAVAECSAPKEDSVPSVVPSFLNSSTLGTLSSLKQKFKL